MQVEPLLVEMIETFRDKFFAELSTEVDKLVEKDFYGYTKVDSTLGYQKINTDYLSRLTDEFEDRAQKIYGNLYRKFSSQAGDVIEAFKKAQKQESLKSHPIDINQYEDE